MPESPIAFRDLKDRVTETWAAPQLSREEAYRLVEAVEQAYHRSVPETDRWFCQVCRKIGGHVPSCPGARFDWTAE
jgi:hypothetical protein